MRRVKVVLIAKVLAEDIDEARVIAKNIAEAAGRMLPTDEETVEVTEVTDEGEVPEEEPEE